jgi:transcription-repair coupling factor
MNYEEYKNTYLSDFTDILYKIIYKESFSKDLIEFIGLKSEYLSFFISLLQSQKRVGEKIVVIFPNFKDAHNLYTELQKIYRSEIALFLPSSDEMKKKVRLPLKVRKLGGNNLSSEKEIILTAAPVLKDSFKMKKEVLTLQVGKEVNLEILLKNLDELGFSHYSEGTENQLPAYRVLGEVVDLFLPDATEIIRIDFFDEEIDLICKLNPETGEITEKLNKYSLYLADSTAQFSFLDYLIEALTGDFIFWIDNPRIVRDSLVLLDEDNGEKIFSRFFDELMDYGFKTYLSAPFSAGLLGGLEYRPHSIKVNITPHRFPVRTGMVLEFFKKELREKIEKRYINLFLVKEKKVYQVLKSLFEEQKFIYQTEDTRKLKGGIAYFLNNLVSSESFFLQDYGINIFSENDLKSVFHLEEKKKTEITPDFDPIKYFSQFREGDFVVHKNHGIAIFQGIKKLHFSDGGKREFLVLSYAKGDKLYVPPDKAYLVQKYIGEEGYTPKLNRLNSQAWTRTKEKIKKSVTVIAQKLVELYAKRMSARGFAFSKTGGWLDELEVSFPFQETPEQKKAIEAVLSDMEQPQPMDRLVCGDVGFGKTEVAIRAAMKAIINDKQVAVLVPTTILARQHFLTFSERFHPFPVKIDYLNRFKSRKEQKIILEKLANGDLDIVIGTHRLLSKDVKFRDLGLLIIDEEHRFGVRQKEKIRELRANVDTLALSATPIPRTLNMALSGIRELSIIMNPPSGRKPVQTVVSPYDENIIREAIERELERNGQVFFLSNRVESLKYYAGILERMFPDVKIAISHGQLREQELEQVYLDFLDKKIDILVTTAIIESGLDIPSCNTIIINNAHQLGLSQMYQLKGRVGRSNLQAYAYFLYPPHVIHNPIVRKRLEAIDEFRNLGDGFKIALRDMELRGAGTLLGYEQSGHILSVGFEMYYEILKESIEELKIAGNLGEDKIETEVELSVPALIPENYIFDFAEKINWYKRISGVKKVAYLQTLRKEMQKEYGKLPLEVENLFAIMRIKLWASERWIEKIYFKRDILSFVFAGKFEIQPEEWERVQKFPGFFRYISHKIDIKLGKRLVRKQLEVCRDFLLLFEKREDDKEENKEAENE